MCKLSQEHVLPQPTVSSYMNTPNVNLPNHEPTLTCRLQNASAQVDGGAGPQSQSRFLLYPSLSGIIAFCWAASRGTLVKMLMSKIQSIVVDWLVGIWHSAIAQPQRAQEGTRPMTDETPRDPVSCGQAQTTSPKKVSWSYLRGKYMVSLLSVAR